MSKIPSYYLTNSSEELKREALKRGDIPLLAKIRRGDLAIQNWEDNCCFFLKLSDLTLRKIDGTPVDPANVPKNRYNDPSCYILGIKDTKKYFRPKGEPPKKEPGHLYNLITCREDENDYWSAPLYFLIPDCLDLSSDDPEDWPEDEPIPDNLVRTLVSDSGFEMYLYFVKDGADLCLTTRKPHELWVYSNRL